MDDRISRSPTCTLPHAVGIRGPPWISRHPWPSMDLKVSMALHGSQSLRFRINSINDIPQCHHLKQCSKIALGLFLPVIFQPSRCFPSHHDVSSIITMFPQSSRCSPVTTMFPQSSKCFPSHHKVSSVIMMFSSASSHYMPKE